MGKKRKRKAPSVLDALAWHASRLGISYGTLSAEIKKEEKERIYKEYSEMILERQEREKKLEEDNKRKYRKETNDRIETSDREEANDRIETSDREKANDRIET